MSTHCNVVQFLEPDPATVLATEPTDHSLQVEESGSVHLQMGQGVYTVRFNTPKLSDSYDFLVQEIVNTIDPGPANLAWTFSAMDRFGFIVTFSQSPTTENYVFNFTVRVPSIAT